MRMNTRGKASIFQVVLLVVFGLFLAGGVLFFAIGGLDGGSNGPQIGRVVIWGTLDDGPFNGVLRALRDQDDSTFGGIAYVQKDAATFDDDLTEALATGAGPDLILLSQDRILSYQNKVLVISYDYYPLNQFRESFVEEGELYLASNGSLGLPLTLDPLVLYWNRDLLTTAGFAQPPRYWNEAYTIAEAISEESETGELTRSAIALGEYENVRHAKDIVSTLVMQAGGSVVGTSETGLRSSLGSGSSEQQPSVSALRFYTEFSNPAKDVYSWNRAQPDSRTAFANGDLALYVGYASERGAIASQNPNLNFGVAALPQAPGTERATTYGRMHALSISRTASNAFGAREAARVLSDSSVSGALAAAYGTPPPRRDLLAAQLDGVEEILRTSALIARAWLDPDPQETNAIFRDLIEDVTSGSRRLTEAVNRANDRIANLLRN